MVYGCKEFVLEWIDQLSTRSQSDSSDVLSDVVFLLMSAWTGIGRSSKMDMSSFFVI